MDPGVLRVYTRVKFLETTSRETDSRAMNVLSELEHGQRVYGIHLEALQQRIQATKQQLDDLKALINKTVTLLKLTAGNAALDTVTKRVDRLNYENLVVRTELEKELQESA